MFHFVTKNYNGFLAKLARSPLLC